MARHTSRRDFIKTALTIGTASALPSLSFGCARPPGLDVIIKGGRVINGLGTPAEVVDVGIAGDRIAAIGDLSDVGGGSVLLARGLVVAPGFIDIHAHTNLVRAPKAESKIFQGVTTDVVGPDGGSAFPRRKEEPESEADYVHHVTECTNYAEWARTQRESPAAMNIGSCVGHETIRRLIVGATLREPTDRELRPMQELVAQALDQGALGLSSGLEYGGGRATPAELSALCRVVAAKGKCYETHMRSEDEFVEEAVEEALQVARETGVSLQISHLKLAGKPNYHKLDHIIEMIEHARNEGLNVHVDRYPYLAWASGMTLFFPQWAKEGGRLAERLGDPAERQRMKAETLAKVEQNGGWEAIMIRSGDADMVGKRVDEIARARGEEPYELVCDHLATAGVIGFSMSDENTERIISLPYCMIASDGSAGSPEPNGGGHPRSFGTFPRAIRLYVRERNVMPLHEMVRKCTSLPADKLGLSDRGRIQENAYADLVVFDSEAFTDHATFLDARRLATGVRYLLVNGEIVIDQGVQTDAMPGRVV